MRDDDRGNMELLALAGLVLLAAGGIVWLIAMLARRYPRAAVRVLVFVVTTATFVGAMLAAQHPLSAKGNAAFCYPAICKVG